MDHRHEDRVADEATGRRGGGLGRGREVLFGTLLLTALSVIGLAATAAPPVQAQGDYSQVTRETVRVPMRDGVELSVDIFRPVTPDGMQVPVILTLTPYHALYKPLYPGLSSGTPTCSTAMPDGYQFVCQGYAYALADVRGTYASGGCWDYGGIKEREDGYDLVEWLGTQPWSNGKVAMIGASYDGTTANAAAVERPPHLGTIVPISAISRWWGYAYQQGARSSYSGESADADPPSDTPTDFMFGYGFLPPPEPNSFTSAQQIAMRWQPCDRAEQFLHGYDTEPDYDDFWIERDYLRRAADVNVPVLVAHGLQDFNVKTWEGTAWFEALPGEKALVIGQWPHASPRGRYPEWEDFLARWFQRWLYGVPNGVEHEPAVRVQTNDREWHMRESWAGRNAVSVPLGTGQRAFFDDGSLTESEMLRGGSNPRFVRLSFPELSGLRITGRPVLRLMAKSDQPSTHFVAVLAEVAANGTITVISRAFMNARYREGLEAGKDLEPGKPYRFDLEFIDKDHIVAPDRHLELFIASSSTSWVFSDERRANNTLDLAASTLELPLAGGWDAVAGSGAPGAVVGRPMPGARPAAGDRVAPRVRVRRVGRVRRGKVRVRVTCPRTEANGCSGRLALRVRAGRRSARLGSRRFRPLAAGRSVVLSFRMGSAARRLARRRRAALVGSVSAADRAGNRRTDRVKLKLR